MKTFNREQVIALTSGELNPIACKLIKKYTENGQKIHRKSISVLKLIRSNIIVMNNAAYIYISNNII